MSAEIRGMTANLSRTLQQERICEMDREMCACVFTHKLKAPPPLRCDEHRHEREVIETSLLGVVPSDTLQSELKR